MDINKLTNRANGKLNGTKASESGPKVTKPSSQKNEDKVRDTVSIKNFSSGKNEKLFARLELEKLNQTSSERLKDFKAKLSEYQKAKEVSPEAANKTDIGKVIDDPDVWADIAQKIIGK